MRDWERGGGENLEKYFSKSLTNSYKGGAAKDPRPPPHLCTPMRVILVRVCVLTGGDVKIPFSHCLEQNGWMWRNFHTEPAHARTHAQTNKHTRRARTHTPYNAKDYEMQISLRLGAFINIKGESFRKD